MVDASTDRVAIIDMTEGDPAGGNAQAGVDAGADPAVVVVADVAGDDDPLPKSAELQDDGSVKLTLRYPVTLKWRKAGTDDVREERHETLHMRRLNGAAMRAVMNAGKGHTVPTGIAQSCRMNQAVFNKLFDMMDGADAQAAAQVLDFFLDAGAPRASGQPSSP